MHSYLKSWIFLCTYLGLSAYKLKKKSIFFCLKILFNENSAALEVGVDVNEDSGQKQKLGL